MEVGFDLITDASGFLNPMAECQKEVRKLNDSTKAFATESTQEFKGVAFGIGNIGDEIAKGAKQTGKMNEEVNKLGKTKSIVQQLKAEIKQLTSEAYKAGEGSKTFTDNLAKAGKLKDQLNSLNQQVRSLTGNIGQNFARAAGNSISVVSKGFEGITALQVLAGQNQKSFEQTLLRLQSLNALASVTQEFAGLSGKITEIKLGFSGFINNATTGFRALWGIIRANPIGAIITAFTALVGLYVLLKDKAAAYFDENIDKLRKSVAGAKEYIEVLKQESDFFLKRAQLQGRDVYAKELEQLSDLRQAVKLRIHDLNELFRIEGELTDEQKELGRELEKELTAITDRITLLKLQRQKEQSDFIKKALSAERDLRIAAIKDDESREKAAAAKKRDDAIASIREEIGYMFDKQTTEEYMHDISAVQNELYNKEIAEIEKKYHEKRLQQRKDLEAAFMELTRRAAAAELEGLTGEERIAREREIGLQEIENLRTVLLAKGREIDKGFQFNEDQLHQFAILENEVYRKTTADLLALQVERQTKSLELEKSSISERIKILELDAQAKEAAVRGTSRPSGMSEADFEAEQQKQILLIKRQSALDTVRIRQEAVDAETSLRIAAGVEDIKLITERGRKEKEVIVNEAKATIAEIDRELEALAQNKSRFSLAKLLGVSDEDVQAISRAINELGAAFRSIMQMQIDAKEQEIQNNRELIESREKNISDLERKLDREHELAKEGKANNVSALNEQIKEQEALRNQDLMNERNLKKQKQELAKQQLNIDTIVQASNLVVAASQIYATTAKDPYTTAIATATIIAMIAAFATQKIEAYKAVNKQNAFKDGVIDLQGPGTSTSDSIPAWLSKGESVMTARETEENYHLLKGIRMDDDRMITRGLQELIRGRGIMLSSDIPDSVARRRDVLNSGKTILLSDNKPMTSELIMMNKKFDDLLKESKSKTYTDGKGNVVRKTGSHTEIIRNVRI